MKNQIVAYATFSKLGIDKLTAEFVSRDNSIRRIFSELGKVFTAMIPQIPTRGQTITAYLKDKGISQGTISNAQYASNAFALVVNGVITESRYDDLTLRECQIISKYGAEKATAAFANRTQWRLELASLDSKSSTNFTMPSVSLSLATGVLAMISARMASGISRIMPSSM